MKYLLIILGVLLILNNYSFGQSEVENIATEVCSNLQQIDFRENSESINKKAMEVIQYTYERRQDLMKTLIKEYAKTYTGKTDVEISKIVGQDITFYLMRDCEVFQRITMFKNEPVPEISATTKKVGDDFTTLLLKRMKTESISQSIVDDCMNTSMDNHAKELSEKFGSKYTLAFAQEFQAYLLTKCEPYMRWTTRLSL